MLATMTILTISKEKLLLSVHTRVTRDHRGGQANEPVSRSSGFRGTRKTSILSTPVAVKIVNALQ